MHFYPLGQGSLHLNNISNQPKDENAMGVLQKTEALSSVLDENKSVNQETSKQNERKIAMYVTPICYCGVIL